METPLLSREIIAVLKYLHGLFNTTVVVLLFYQAALGLSIRRHRTSGAQPPLRAVRWHRKAGPILTLLAGLGFAAGITLVLIDKGDLFKYPLHLLGGLIFLLLLLTTYTLSRRIRGPAPGPRTLHFVFGLAVLVFALGEVFLGLGILL